ncbi:MAG TPA: hypothetical protein VGB15_18270 [Longimicrobium sp.]|jgi:hypothetical protein
MKSNTPNRALLAAVLVGGGVCLVGGVAFFLGVQAAEEQATREVNAMMRLQERLYGAYARNGEFPPPGIDDYEFPGLTVSHQSDTSVSFYSGLDQARFLTLHIRKDGVLLTSRP